MSTNDAIMDSAMSGLRARIIRFEVDREIPPHLSYLHILDRPGGVEGKVASQGTARRVSTLPYEDTDVVG